MRYHICATDMGQSTDELTGELHVMVRGLDTAHAVIRVLLPGLAWPESCH